MSSNNSSFTCPHCGIKIANPRRICPQCGGEVETKVKEIKLNQYTLVISLIPVVIVVGSLQWIGSFLGMDSDNALFGVVGIVVMVLAWSPVKDFLIRTGWNLP